MLLTLSVLVDMHQSSNGYSWASKAAFTMAIQTPGNSVLHSAQHRVLPWRQSPPLNQDMPAVVGERTSGGPVQAVGAIKLCWQRGLQGRGSVLHQIFRLDSGHLDRAAALPNSLSGPRSNAG